jgi:hypothetical protein
VETIVVRISGERRVFVELSNGVGARATGKTQAGNSLWSFKHHAAAPAHQIRIERLCAHRAGEQIPEAVHH